MPQKATPQRMVPTRVEGDIFAEFAYDTNHTMEEVMEPGYFQTLIGNLAVGDIIRVRVNMNEDPFCYDDLVVVIADRKTMEIEVVRLADHLYDPKKIKPITGKKTEA